eukprot:SAG11_NODE_3821_length_2207_cov_2.433586_4_plen_64_part_00
MGTELEVTDAVVLAQSGLDLIGAEGELPYLLLILDYKVNGICKLNPMWAAKPLITHEAALTNC